MPTVRIEHAIRDFDAWKVAFDRDPARRESSTAWNSTSTERRESGLVTSGGIPAPGSVRGARSTVARPGRERDIPAMFA